MRSRELAVQHEANLLAISCLKLAGETIERLAGERDELRVRCERLQRRIDEMLYDRRGGY